MNKYKSQNRIGIFCMLIVLLLVSCTDNFSDINTEPYTAGKEEMMRDNYLLKVFFPQMQNYVIPAQENAYQHCENMIGGSYGRYMTITKDAWKTNFSTFNAPESWLDYPFENVFSKVYGGWTEIRTLTEGEGVIFEWAQILRVAAMHRITDLYGPIPYSKMEEAGEGLGTPYDDQKTVYELMFKDLTKAINEMTGYVARNPDARIMAESDLIYNGDFRQWVKFANSLKLRMAMRIRFADPDLARRMAEEAVNHSIGIIRNNTDNALSAYHKNPINVMWDAYKDTRVCADITSYMEGYKDPRREKYFQKGTIPGNDGYYGLRTGISVPVHSFSIRYSAPVAGPEDKLLWMNAAEIAFLRAEGAMLGWDMGGTDEYFYNEGIRLSFEQYNVMNYILEYLYDDTSTPADYNDPALINSESAISTITIKWNRDADEEEKLERIITQKWIAMWTLGHEAWGEYRRTGYPRFFPVKVNNSGEGNLTTLLARRIPYPPSEFHKNKNNYNTAVQLLGAGGDKYGTRLWWDKK